MNNPLNDEMKSRVINKFNLEFNTLESLSKCYDLKNTYENERHELEKSLSVSSENITSQLCKVIINIQDSKNKIDTVNEQSESLLSEINNHLKSTEKVILNIQNNIAKSENIDYLDLYIKTAKKIENISNELHQSLVDNDEELSVALFSNLCEISVFLRDTPATHLALYLRDIIHHWHNYLKDKFSVRFEEILTIIKWPFVSTNFSLSLPPQDAIKKLQLLTEYLILIELPEERAPPVITSALLSDFPPLCLPMQFLIRPLRKRFFFHFYGNKQTNRQDKPEWYMTQILTWIRDHEKFITSTIQPVIDRLAMHHVNAKLELMRGLVELCVEKLHGDLPWLSFDDTLFSHCVDEALGMDRELRQVYGYPASQPGILVPLTHAAMLQKWLKMEKKYALEKMDAMLSSETAWELISVTENDEMMVTECGDSFITLLATMTERYQSLSQPGHKLQFLDLQIELLDDFRVRLLQLLHFESNDIITSKSPQILNTINYIIYILTEWSGTLHYIHLHYFKNNLFQHEEVNTNDDESENSEQNSVFDETLSLYEHMKKDLLLQICEAVFMDIKARSRPYRNDKWSEMPLVNDPISLSITVSACPMFQLVATRLHQLEELMASELFSQAWKNIARHLNKFLFEELILENHFSEGAAMQLNYDMTRNMFPLFAQYTKNPDVYFIHIKEACILLNLTRGSAILLLETLKEKSSKEPLNEIGVKHIDIKTALSVLNNRIDLIHLSS